MVDFFEQKSEEMLEMTKHHVQELMSLWRDIFGTEECKENVCKLVHHAKNFYTDLIKESLEKKAYIEKEICDLQEEGETLRRLLKTDVQMPTINNGASNKPLLVVQMEMDKNLTAMRECMRKRREEICELLLEQEELCEELGEPPRPLLADPLPTELEIADFRAHLCSLQALRVERMNQFFTMRREIKEFLQTLDLSVNTDTEQRLLHDCHIKLNADTFERLSRMHINFGEQVQELRSRINTMRNQLEMLWQRLDTSPNTRQKFRALDACTQHTHDVIYGELHRCEKLKRQNVKLFVEQLRSELELWWDKTLKSEVERSCFTHYNSNCYTDDLLVLHEMELEDLKRYYEDNHQIFELYAERQKLWERMTALEAKANDPARYNNRGGQLLREEKERKTIANKLPKIEQQITELVHVYEEQQHAKFLIYGENILEAMAAQWAQKRQQKEQHTTARKQKTPIGKSMLTTTRTPLALKNASSHFGSSVSIPRFGRTPAMQTLQTRNVSTSQKRKLNVRERNAPSAKRSLMHVLDSPSLLLKPPSAHHGNVSAASTASTALTSSNATMQRLKLRHGPQFKSPLKKKVARVIATTINRRSQGRHSNGATNAGSKKKRHSRGGGKGHTPAKLPPPKIKVIHCPQGCSDDDIAYESFQKCIETRSSMIQPDMASKQQKRRAPLTPSKQSLRDYTVSTANHRVPRILPTSPGASRKLTTKNLPIMI